MEQRLTDIRTYARLNILRLYPAHKQSGLTDRTDLDAWIAANREHMNVLAADESLEIDEGWPCPHEWQTVEGPKKCNLEQAIDEAQPPEEIADIYEAYGMDPHTLFKLHTDLTSKIAGKLATDDERALQIRLTPHVPWLKKRARSIEVV
jgi:hypothetical protein